jgi:hypothetical protein
LTEFLQFVRKCSLGQFSFPLRPSYLHILLPPTFTQNCELTSEFSRGASVPTSPLFRFQCNVVHIFIENHRLFLVTSYTIRRLNHYLCLLLMSCRIIYPSAVSKMVIVIGPIRGFEVAAEPHISMHSEFLNYD